MTQSVTEDVLARSRSSSVSNESDTPMEDPGVHCEGSATASGSSISSSSPLISPSHIEPFDLSQYMSVGNPELSSSSSESLSQGSREQSPSDWPSTWAEPGQLFSDSWKWNANSFVDSAFVDPTTLTLGNDSRTQSDSYDPMLPPSIDATSLLAAFTQGLQANGDQASTLLIPHIVEPPSTSPFPAAQPAAPISLGVQDIAKRAKERVGVQQAIPLSAVKAESQPSFIPFYSTPDALQAAKLSSTYASPVSLSAPPPPELPPAPMRNKSSHTDIERKYRSKLNNRFIALRHAVPALRILEKERFPEEKVDERGYVDGVKAARKASKGSILGKAADYINVLKKRGERIQREYDGLKALVFSLVGGRELYENWEREWREQFGGEEADINEEEDDDEDGSDDEDDKPKKRARTSPAAPSQKEVKVEVAPTPPAAIPPPGSGELKRKRGRPRKIQPTVAASETPPALAPQTPSYTFMPQQQTHPQAVGPGKLFLGVFLLFSLFNSPSSNSLHSHTHTGTVLGSISQSFLPDRAVQYISSPALQPLATSKLVNYTHSAVTLVLFISVMMSMFPSFTHRLASFWKRTSPKNLIQSSDLEGDKYQLRTALGCGSVNFPMLISAVVVGTWYAFWAWLRHLAGIRPRPISVTLERKAWFRLAELELADGASMTFERRAFLSGRLASFLHSPTASEMATLALLSYPLPTCQPLKVWTRACHLTTTKEERILLELPLEDVVALYESGLSIMSNRDYEFIPETWDAASPSSSTSDDPTNSRIKPLGLIATGLVCQRLKRAANGLFVVKSPHPTDSSMITNAAIVAPEDGSNRDESDGLDLSEVLALGKGLTKRVKVLVSLWESVSSGVAPSFFLKVDVEKAGDDFSDAISILEAIALYQKVISPPTSPSVPCQFRPSISHQSPSHAHETSQIVSDTEAPSAACPPAIPLRTSVSPAEPQIIPRETNSGLACTAFSSSTPMNDRLSLLRILASYAFDHSYETETARDRLVDWLRDDKRLSLTVS